MTDRNEIFSGTKQVDDKLKIDKESLNDYLKKLGPPSLHHDCTLLTEMGQ